MLQALIKSFGGTVETYFPAQPSTTTVSVYSGEGGIKVDEATCTLDSVSTTLSAAVAAEAETLSVASASGIAVGRRYLVGGSDEPPEVVAVKSVSSTTITPWAPLVHAHASGVAFKGLRAWYAVPAADADNYWWDGYAVFTPTNGEPQSETVDCVRRKIPENLIDETDIRQIIPKSQKALSVELDLSRAFREARDQMLLDFGGKNRAQTFLGTDNFRRPCAIKFWLLRRMEFGEEEWGTAFDALQREYDRLMTHLIEQTPLDADQDGATTGQNDGGMTMISLERS